MPQTEPRRHSMRLADFDYSEYGAYFVTICTQNRVELFGSVVADEMHSNAAGAMIEQWWAKLPGKFSHVEIDEFTVMPNHVHGLLFINGADVAVNEPPQLAGQGGHAGPPLHVSGALSDPPAPNGAGGHAGPPLQVSGAPLPRIMQWFKTMTTNAYFDGVRIDGWTPVIGKVWQRGYYDHIVRRGEALNDIRQYIIDNPRKWSEDEHNPAIAS